MTGQLMGKDLTILEDQLDHEMLAYKKCVSYGTQLKDVQLQSFAYSLAEQHKQHYGSLLNYLNSHN